MREERREERKPASRHCGNRLFAATWREVLKYSGNSWGFPPTPLDLPVFQMVLNECLSFQHLQQLDKDKSDL